MKKYKRKSKNPNDAIVKYCLNDCCNGDKEERDNCRNKHCQLWRFRKPELTLNLDSQESEISIAKMLIEWNETNPLTSTYSHDRMVKIASKMKVIYDAAKSIVENYK